MLFIVFSILLTWLLCAAACVGIGSLLLRLLWTDSPQVVIPSAARDLLPASESNPLDRSLRTGHDDSSSSTFRPSDVPTFRRPSLQDSFWTGFALITAILQLYHFFRSIDSLALILLIALALAGLLLSFRRSDVPTFRRS